jgi:hypothetical protein
MFKTHSLLSTTLVFVSALCLGACGKAPPKSTTTTHTQTTTSTDAGDKASSDAKVTTVEERDGSQTVKRTETTSTTVPAPTPTTPTK